jgi:uncharacterized delta-60 repeat protein
MSKQQFVGSALVSALVFSPSPVQTQDNPFTLTAPGPVYTISIEPNGQILAGHAWSPLQLNPDGSVKHAFSVPGAGSINTSAVQEQSQLVFGGNFNGFDGHAFTNIARLNAALAPLPLNLLPDDGVFALATGPNGGLILGGLFSTINGIPRPAIARLASDGNLDPNFNPPLDGGVFALVVQSDGAILVGGEFITVEGVAHTNLCRLTSAGNLDGSFTPPEVGFVASLALQAHGALLVATARPNTTALPNDLIRLSNSGSLDLNFRPEFDGDVNSIAVQADGKILVGGTFTEVNGTSRNGLARLNSDGTLDASLGPQDYTTVYALALQKNGMILVGGEVADPDNPGLFRNLVQRLANTESATETLTADAQSITWLRGGTGPEVTRTRFYTSNDAANWTEAGAGTRIPGGWQLQGLSLPANPRIRAIGWASVGQYNSPSWFIESSVGGASAQPEIITNDSFFGYTAGQFRFNYAAPAGQPVVIEASTNLVQWTSLSTNTGPGSFTEPGATQSPHRFYRLRLP